MKRVIAILFTIIFITVCSTPAQALLPDKRYSAKSAESVRYASFTTNQQTVYTYDEIVSAADVLDSLIADPDIGDVENEIFEITRPEDLPAFIIIYGRSIYIGGQLIDPSFKITIAVYNNEEEVYKEIEFQEGVKGINSTPLEGYFSVNLALDLKDNRFKVFGYDPNAFSSKITGTYEEVREKLIENNAFQTKVFTIYSLGESVRHELSNTTTTNEHFRRLNKSLIEGLEE